MPIRFETLAVHGGQHPDPATLSRGVPVYRTSSYLFKSAEHAAKLFGLAEQGNVYGRLGNPTQAMLEERMSLLEGGVGALASASGTSAIFSTIVNLAKQGDEIVSANNLYGGTFTLFNDILPQFGITTRFVKPQDFDKMEAAVNGRTRALYVEAIGNPALDVVDLDAVSAIAKRHGLPLVVDATFATPYLLRPFEHGADIVVHSLTKWLGGHGTALGGIVVDGGTFDWTDSRFSLYVEPDASYHYLRWGYDLPEGYPPFITRMRLVPLRNLGACISPDNAWMILQGLETLPLRIERHCANALKVAYHLKQHPKVAWVRYPGLPDDPAHAVACRYACATGSGAWSFSGFREASLLASGSSKNLASFRISPTWAMPKSLALHPASTSHAQLSEEQQRDAGLPPELIRLSIGIEHIDDILEDLDQALGES